MTATQSDLAGLSRYIFTAPSWYASLGFALAIAAMAGIAAFDSGSTDPTWRNLLILGRDAWQGIFFIGLPTVIASLGTTGVDRFVGGKLTPNRSSLLALLCEVILVAIVIGAGIVALLTPLGQTFVYDALVIALASIFAFRLLVVMAVSQSSLLIAAVPASLQTVVSALFLFVYSGTVRFLELGGPLVDAYLMPYLSRASEAPPELWVIDAHHFQLLAITCVLYAGGVYTFIRVIDRPWQRSLGVSVLDFIRGFVGHVAEGSRELEDFFEKLGEEAIVPVTVLAFRRRDGTQKARFVLPMIHPGPMGEIGGGNFPVRVAEHTDGLVFPPHATAGHDFNLVTEREVDSILEAIDAAQANLAYSAEATRSVRTRSGEASMLGQAFGDDALLVATYAPGFADDVEYGVGLSAAAEARTVGLDDVLLVDAHNSNNGLQGEDLGHVTPGSQRAFDMITAAKQAGQRLSEAPTGPIRLGVAWERTDWDALDGIGPLGVRVAVVEVDDQHTAYVLVDGNNMVPGLRDRVVDAVTARGPIDVAEVMTTDTHIVNTVEADNQVGAAIDHGEFVATIERLVDAGVDDLEPVEAGLATERTTVTVFGNDRTETLASHANAVVSMGGALAAVIILVAMAVSVLIFFLT
jgi:putative membrane protein